MLKIFIPDVSLKITDDYRHFSIEAGWRIYCVTEVSHHCFRQWLVACSAPSHYLNQCWLIVYWILSSKFQWNSNRNSNIFIEENMYENIVCKMVAILSRPQCVNKGCIILSSSRQLVGIVIQMLPPNAILSFLWVTDLHQQLFRWQ